MPLSFNLPLCAVGQVDTRIADCKTPGVRELWGFLAVGLGLPAPEVSASENVCPAPWEQVWWVVWQARFLRESSGYSSEHCWLLSKFSRERWGAQGHHHCHLHPPWEQWRHEPHLSLCKQTPASVRCCSLSLCSPCQEPRGWLALPNPHPPGLHLGAFLNIIYLFVCLFVVLGGFLENQELP